MLNLTKKVPLNFAVENATQNMEIPRKVAKIAEPYFWQKGLQRIEQSSVQKSVERNTTLKEEKCWSVNYAGQDFMLHIIP